MYNAWKHAADHMVVGNTALAEPIEEDEKEGQKGGDGEGLLH